MDETPRISRQHKIIIGSVLVLLCLVAVGYYSQFFTRLVRWPLAIGFTGLIGLHYWIGRRLFKPRQAFPFGWFIVATAVFSAIRWAYTTLFLQYHLTSDTVFHHPDRVLWFLVPSSAVLIFIGYGVALYQYLRTNNGRFTAEDDVPEAVDPNKSDTDLQFRSGGKEVRLPVADLLYVQANGEYVLYYCTDRKYARFQRLKEAAAELAPHGFVRIHRSHIVARTAVRARSSAEAELVDGTKLSISRTYRDVLT